MSDVPTVVGINRTQDGSLCVVRGTSALYSLQKERVTRRKHHWGRLGDLPNHYKARMPFLDEPIDLVVECWSSDAEVERREEYRQELLSTLTFRGEPRIVEVSHHLAHVYSAFHPSPYDRAAIMVVDAQGSPARDFTERVPGLEGADPDLLEIASFYVAERGGAVECLAKHVWDGDWNQPEGLGCFYSLFTRMMFPEGDGNEGKIMGLAPFGRAGTLGMPPLVVDGHRVFIPEEWMKLFQERDRFLWSNVKDDASFRACADFAAEGQAVWEAALLQLASWLHERSGAEDLCFAGGTALNCSANGRLMHESPFRRVFVPPSPHDGGTAIGCAIYGQAECLGVEPGFRWVNDFLGPEMDAAAVDACVGALDDAEFDVSRPDDLAGTVAELIESGRVVGVCHGRSESGPRALGNRSILADARHPKMQDFINFEVKGREWFRPLAPLVLLERVSEYFDLDRPAPFMQFATDVLPEKRAEVPAITHVDGSARIQTVEPVQTPFLHRIMKAFEARTGCAVMLNTSLNGKGDPVVETPEEGIDCLRKTSMHAMAMPPYLIRKRQEPAVPPREG